MSHIVMMGVKTLAAQVEEGTAKLDGDVSVLEQLASTMVQFELGFEIIPGTIGAGAKTDLNPFEVALPAVPE